MSKGNKVVSVRLDDDLIAYVEELQMAYGCSVSEAVQQIIRDAREADKVWGDVRRWLKGGKGKIPARMLEKLFPSTFPANQEKADKYERGRRHVTTAADVAIPRTVWFSEAIDNRTAAGDGFDSTRRTKHANMDGGGEYDSVMPQGGKSDMRSDNPTAGERDKKRRQRLKAAGDGSVMSAANDWGDIKPRRLHKDA
jgi:hypothetical protein